MKIMFLGDVHGDFSALSYFIEEHAPDYLFIAGDVGYFWGYNPKDSIGKIRPGNTKVYWVAGNHENHDIIKCSGKFSYGKIHRLEKNIYFCAFGSVLKIPKGPRILFCGGADSIDKNHRTEGRSWWRNETIQNAEFDALPDPKKAKIDIVVSHTKPTNFDLNLGGYRTEKYYDPSCIALQQIFDMYKPKLWFFGHFHHMQRGKWEGCEWFALDCLGVGFDGRDGYRTLGNLDYQEDEDNKYFEKQARIRAAYREETEHRKDPNYVHLSLWPDNVDKPKWIPSEKDLDF